MTGPRRESKRSGKGRGTKSEDGNTEQIEYLLYQSTQGIHFMFHNSEIANVMREPTDEEKFFTTSNMEKVQGLLTGFLDRPTFKEKRSYLEALPRDEYELLIRAYFHLVENTILAHSTIRH